MAIPYDLTMVANMRRVEFGVSILVLFFFFSKCMGSFSKMHFGGLVEKDENNQGNAYTQY